MCQKRGRASPIRHHHVPTTPTSDFPNRRKVIKLSLSNALTEFRKKVRYSRLRITNRSLIRKGKKSHLYALIRNYTFINF